MIERIRYTKLFCVDECVGVHSDPSWLLAECPRYALLYWYCMQAHIKGLSSHRTAQAHYEWIVCPLAHRWLLAQG